MSCPPGCDVLLPSRAPKISTRQKYEMRRQSLSDSQPGSSTRKPKWIHYMVVDEFEQCRYQVIAARDVHSRPH
jgi:hypothetical protein